jgi:hypothetical protein
MKTLTYGEFLEKLDRYALVAKRRGEGASWSDLAEEFKLRSPAVAATVVRCYERHSATPRLPVLASLSHATVAGALKALPFKDIPDLRSRLIRDYSASTGGRIRPYPTTPKRPVKILMDASGLDWFEKDGRPFIHWKHTA